MKLHHTHVFTFAASEHFAVERENAVSVWLKDGTAPSPIQQPTIRVSLQPVADYAHLDGKALEERFHAFNLASRYKAETIETFQTELQGEPCFVQLARTDATFQGEQIQVSYYFAMVQINAQYVIELSGDVLTEAWETYRPQFEAVWQSLTFETDLSACKRAEELFDEALDRLLRQDVADQAERTENDQQQWLENYIASVEKIAGNCFQLGDYPFDVVWEENRTHWNIGKMTRQFHCEIVAKTREPDKLIANEILSDFNDEGELKISFDFKGLYRNGLPKADITVAQSKIISEQYAGFRFDGEHYGLIYFDGKIIIDENGVCIFGILHDALSNGRKFPVNVQLALRADDLDWNDYTFTTLVELQSAPPALVKFIDLHDAVAELPPVIRACKALESLSIRRTHQKQLGLQEIPDWLGELTALENLTLTGPEIKKLPDTIAALPRLRRLFLSNTAITQLPDAIWQMPSLEAFFLNDNQLEAIPDSVHLPNAKWLELARNQLNHLPEKIASFPHLKSLKLKGNPWECIPPTIAQVADVDLEIEYKQRFFDYGYKGADGKGTLEWDDQVFYAMHDAPLMQSIAGYWKDKAVAPYREDVARLLKKAIGFPLGAPEDYQQIGNHRVGGMPDLPQHIAYPSFSSAYGDDDHNEYKYEFIAQINCTAIAHLQDYLPRTGMLYFFLSTIHNVYGGSNAAKVIYFEGDAKELQSGTHFRFKQDDYYEALEDVPYEGYKADAHAFADLPEFYPIHQNEYLLHGLSPEFTEAVLGDQDMGDPLNEAFEAFRQENSVAVNSYGFSQHEYPEHEVALAYKGKPADWIILLKVPSVGDFQWGDAGDLFFVVHKSDLAKRDFSNVVCTMYSS